MCPWPPCQGGALGPSGRALTVWSCGPWLGALGVSMSRQQPCPVAWSGVHAELLQVTPIALYVAQSGVFSGLLWVSKAALSCDLA